MRGKPLILSRPLGTSARRAAKAEAEAGFQSGALPRNPPVELAGMAAGRAAWRGLMKAHDALPSPLYNLLDRGALLIYCQAVQACQDARGLAKTIAARFEKGEAELKDLIAARTELRQSARLVSDLSKQLYLTPRSRGGIAPPPRELSPEEVIAAELRDMDNLFGDDEP